DFEPGYKLGAGHVEGEDAPRALQQLYRLQARELVVADDAFRRGSEVDRALDDAFLSAVRDGSGDDGEGRAQRGPKHQKTSRGSRMKRAGRPNVPKTFGSRRGL